MFYSDFRDAAFVLQIDHLKLPAASIAKGISVCVPDIKAACLQVQANGRMAKSKIHEVTNTLVNTLRYITFRCHHIFKRVKEIKCQIRVSMSLKVERNINIKYYFFDQQ